MNQDGYVSPEMISFYSRNSVQSFLYYERGWVNPFLLAMF